MEGCNINVKCLTILLIYYYLYYNHFVYALPLTVRLK